MNWLSYWIAHMWMNESFFASLCLNRMWKKLFISHQCHPYVKTKCLLRYKSFHKWFRLNEQEWKSLSFADLIYIFFFSFFSFFGFVLLMNEIVHGFKLLLSYIAYRNLFGFLEMWFITCFFFFLFRSFPFGTQIIMLTYLLWLPNRKIKL